MVTNYTKLFGGAITSIKKYLFGPPVEDVGPKAVYADFEKFLDYNHGVGDAITAVQKNASKGRSVLKHVKRAADDVNGMLECYEKISGKHALLREQVERIVTASLGNARVYDSFIGEPDRSPAEIECCLSEIKGSVTSTSDEMRYPEKPGFRPWYVRTLQDASIYMHGSVLDEIFTRMDGFHKNRKRNGGAMRLKEYDSISVLDLGGAISCQADGKGAVSKDNVKSVPLRAVLESYPLRGMRVFASHDFMNAQVKLGWVHHATVEAMIKKDDFREWVENYADNNYVRLRYIEATNSVRLDYMKKVMENMKFEGMKFNVRKTENGITAEIKGRYPDSAEKTLKEIFRLLASCEFTMEHEMNGITDDIVRKEGLSETEAAEKLAADTARKFEAGVPNVYDSLYTPENKMDQNNTRLSFDYIKKAAWNFSPSQMIRAALKAASKPLHDQSKYGLYRSNK